MWRCSAFFIRSIAFCCCCRYPAYLISVSTDLSSLRTLELTTEGTGYTEGATIGDPGAAVDTGGTEDTGGTRSTEGGFSWKKAGARSRRIGRRFSIVISGRLRSWARG